MAVLRGKRLSIQPALIVTRGGVCPGRFISERQNTPLRMSRYASTTFSLCCLASLFSDPVLAACKPAIERWSGYLPLVVRASDAGGSGLQVGRFWALSAHQDLTAWLTFHTQGALEGRGRYRWANDRAWFEMQTRLAGLISDSEAQDYFTDQQGWQGDVSLSGDWFINRKLQLKGSRAICQS